MKIISWNINGLRAALGKGFAEFLSEQQPDIICLQEIKIGESALLQLMPNFPGYRAYWHSAKRPGYSGTGVLVKNSLAVSVKNGLGDAYYDDEGRVQTVEVGGFFLVNVYFPNSGPELARLAYKQSFNDALLSFILRLEKKKPVIITGDFNVAHEEIDLARPKDNVGSAGFTPAERAWFSTLLSSGYQDSFREFYPDKIQYSWWSFRTAARNRNIGWRIDYFVISAKLRRKLHKSFILDLVLGSDHAPVGIELS